MKSKLKNSEMKQIKYGKKEKRGEGINFFNVDNIEFMKETPNKFYDLAIVDPPYGFGNLSMLKKMHDDRRKTKKLSYYNNIRPSDIYFKELFRISKNQIIFGGNYFTYYLPISKGWIWWRKLSTSKFSDGELAWTSFNKVAKEFTYKSQGNYVGYENNIKLQKTSFDGCKIHPTQKPTELYRWILLNYAKKGDKIIDTHGGSMTIAKACDMEGFDLDICEIDKTYFKNGIEAYRIYKSNLKLFCKNQSGLAFFFWSNCTALN
ncbi:MAG: DNA methyltransferase [Candidatus Thorarchaeota archaeon]